VSGEIIELNVEDGDSVRLGQGLVKIRPDTWLSQQERAEASLSQQRANLESSKSALSRSEAQFTRVEAEFKRQEKLYSQKVISDADMQLAKQNYEVAKNDLSSARQTVEAAKFIVNSTEASVKESRENVRKTLVVAPLTGIVSKLSVKKGERVVGTATMGGTEMLRIADLNKMEVRVNVNENDIVPDFLFGIAYGTLTLSLFQSHNSQECFLVCLLLQKSYIIEESKTSITIAQVACLRFEMGDSRKSI
jgi:HlyD family secretion protein